jgi:exosortase
MSFLRKIREKWVSGPAAGGPILLLVSLWSWAAWACAEHWQSNPNYSYGWVVPPLALAFVIRRFLRTPGSDLPARDLVVSMPLLIGISAALFGAGFFLEYWREEVWHPVIVIWSIAAIAVFGTLIVCRLEYGKLFAQKLIFPVSFFFTAVPWPPRIEQPITSTLMRWVAMATTESLHWLGVEAQASGGAIALRTGLVGITEACSGIRSLQAGIMFGFAMGEWFLLTVPRRIVLLGIAIALAMATNFSRTLALALQAQRHGIESIDQVHDRFGNIAITALVLAIWIFGRMLRPRATRENAQSEVAPAVTTGTRRTAPIFAAVAVSLVIAIASAHILSARLDVQSHSQGVAFFTAKIDNSNGNSLGKIPREIWTELRPTSGEYVIRQDASLPRGRADCFHFFWKPSPWNRFALVHRPDICMPGIGWQLKAAAEPRELEIDGHRLGVYLFRFQRGRTAALEAWGAWRNGTLVPVNYKPDQVLGVEVPPPSLYLEGKRGSATEILSCSVISDDLEVTDDIALEILRATFKYNPQ